MSTVSKAFKKTANLFHPKNRKESSESTKSETDNKKSEERPNLNKTQFTKSEGSIISHDKKNRLSEKESSSNCSLLIKSVSLDGNGISSDPNQTNPLVFGSSLVCLIQRENNEDKVPVFLKSTATRIREKYLDEEGLFRISGNQKRILELKKQLNEKGNYDFSQFEKPHTIAGLMKLFFRDLSEPLLTFKLFDSWNNARNIEQMKLLISKLPFEHQTTLRYLISFLKDVSEHSNLNKMNAKNLAAVFGPNLSKSKHNELAIGSVYPIEKMILEFDEMFSGVNTNKKPNNNFMFNLQNSPYFKGLSNNELEQLRKDIQNSDQTNISKELKEDKEQPKEIENEKLDWENGQINVPSNFLNSSNFNQMKQRHSNLKRKKILNQKSPKSKKNTPPLTQNDKLIQETYISSLLWLMEFDRAPFNIALDKGQESTTKRKETISLILNVYRNSDFDFSKQMEDSITIILENVIFQKPLNLNMKFSETVLLLRILLTEILLFEQNFKKEYERLPKEEKDWCPISRQIIQFKITKEILKILAAREIQRNFRGFYIKKQINKKTTNNK
ncbi:rho gtpase-activating protein 68f [Anaeramoeba flamelloides]|uniref:Rho gtpase-activating protein 68f n=1 Tax=Anaeramoeba flamelloides TaxID=1746091 RepID=A0ABQ8YD90_9EUKA|nr:rho gtpase-activating protein 68f [Anaeramoeba flamelloides]